jgi:hypothetical protein
MLVSSSDSKKFLEDMAQFHSIEQQLIATGNFEDDKDAIIDNLFSQIIEPYTPYGNQGPRVTLQSSISLVNRYLLLFIIFFEYLISKFNLLQVLQSTRVLRSICPGSQMEHQGSG